MTYLVGDLLVILGDGYLVVSSYTPYQTATTPLYPSITDPIDFGTVFTTYSYMAPTPGMGGPSSMVVIVYSKYSNTSPLCLIQNISIKIVL